jgi:hypothetical protein
MLTGQILVFLLILQAALTIRSYVSETSRELDRLSTLSQMEIISDNAMLDCCMRVFAWSTGDPETTAAQILAQAGGWEEGVEEHLGRAGLACALSLGRVMVEPMCNQTLDPLQMGFLGTNGSGLVFISAVLTVKLEKGDFCTERAYPIRVAA